MWKLSIEDDQGQQTVVNLVRDEYSIGRAEANTIRLTDRNVSRHHASLHRQRDQWFLDRWVGFPQRRWLRARNRPTRPRTRSIEASSSFSFRFPCLVPCGARLSLAHHA